MWMKTARKSELHMWVGRCGDSITGPEMILVPVYFYFEEKIVKNKFSSSIREFDWTISESEFFVRLCSLLSLLFDLAVFFLPLLANNPCRTNIRNRRMPLWHGTADQWNRSAMTAIRSTNKKAKNGKNPKSNKIHFELICLLLFLSRRLCSFLIYIWCAAAMATALMEKQPHFAHHSNAFHRFYAYEKQNASLLCVRLIVIVVAVLQIENTRFGFPFSQ